MSDDVSAALAKLGLDGGTAAVPLSPDDAIAKLQSAGLIPTPAPQTAPPAQASGSGLDNFIGGLEKGVMDLGRGARSLVVDTLAAPPFGSYFRPLAAQYRQQADAIKQQDAPLMATTGGKIGDFVAQSLPALATLPFGGEGILAKLAYSALSGGAQGAAQPVGVNDSRALNAAIGTGAGIIGQGIGSGLGAALGGASAASPTIAAAQDFANRYGGVLTRGQISGSPFTQRVEKMLASLPGSSSFYRTAAQKNAAATAAGMNAVTGGDAGNLIQQAGANKSFLVDAPFVNDMRSIADRFAGVADRDAPNGALKTVDQYIGTATPNPALSPYPPAVQAQMVSQGIPQFVSQTAPKYAIGDTMPLVGPYGDFNNYQGLRSLYGYRAQSGDPTDKAAYNLIQDAFDNAAQRSLTAQGADPLTMQAVQKAYAAQKIAQPARVVDADGNVTFDPAKLVTAVSKVDAKKPGMIDNLGPAGEALRQAAAFGQVATPLKSSGTAEGNIAGHIATTGGLGMLGGALGDLLSGGSLLHHAGAALTGAASLYGMPLLVNGVLQGTRNGVVSPLAAELIARGGGSLPMGLLSLTQ